MITDHNHAVADSLANSTVNNVNSIGWNSLNGGFRIGQNTTLSNLFIRAGDDSLMMWGNFITVTNATVWQTYNGAVVNLGWGNDSPGDYGLIDGLYVVKTDWNSPAVPSWTATKLNGQNDAVIASLMIPGTAFGTVQPSLYRNIFVEDSPQTLLSLKITFPECADPNSPRFGSCEDTTLTDSSVLNLNIENLSSPPSVVENSIGFQTLPPGFTDGTQTFPSGYTLTGSMNIGLNNVIVTSSNGLGTTLTSSNAPAVGKIGTNGGAVNQNYGAPMATQALAQIAAGGTLTTGIFVLNTSTAPTQFSLQFFDDQGRPLSLPFRAGSTDTVSGSLPAQGSAYFEAGNPQIATLQGWAQVTSDSPIVVQALFRNNASGKYYEAAVPSTPIGNEFVIPFDATMFATTGQPFVTGIAIANVNSAVASVTCTAYNSNGVAIPNAVPVPALPALGHWAAFSFPLLNGLRGTIDCLSNTNISGIALRALGSELTSLPVVTNPAYQTGSANTGALAQLAAGGGLTTGFLFLNTSNAPANYSMNLYSDQGTRLAMPFANGTSNQLAGTIPAHGLAYYETINPQLPLQQGWGLFSADAPIVVQALFRNGVNGTYYEAAVPSTSGGINEVVFPFDATAFAATGQPLVTGVAIANLNTFTANITCVAIDQTGTVIPNAVQIPALPPLGHWAGYQFPALNGLRGTIDCTSNTNISATALRALGSALSSLPVVTK